MRGGDPLADLRGIALGCVAAEQPAGQRRDELGQFRVHGGGRGGLFVAHTRPHGARGLRGLLVRALQRLGARALGRALGLGQQRVRRGGLFALRAAASLPTVRGLVMVAATPRFVRAADWPHAVDATVFGRFGEELAGDYAGTLDRFIALDTLGSEHGRAELKTLRTLLHARGEPDPEALQAGLRLLDASDLRPALPRLAVPSLWLGGRRDRLVDPRGMAAAAALAPRSRFVELAGAAHAPFLGHAADVAAEIGAFADNIAP